MSGLGPIQRRICRAFLAHPGREFRTDELAEWCYPRLTGKPDRHHRRAIRRAADGVAVRAGRLRRGRKSRTPGGVLWKAKP